MNLEGVYTALVTPFAEDGSLDVAALERLVDFQIEGGISGIVPTGTTGESPTLTHEENNDVVELVVKRVNGRLPVIAGTGSNSTAEAIRMTRRAKENGADASLQVTPYYNKPSDEGLYRHFSEIADKGGLPIILYNIPGRTSRNIELGLLQRLAKHPNIIAVKEASGSIPQIMDSIAQTSLTVLSGDDSLCLPTVAVGGKGIISVASNVIPRDMQAFVGAALRGEMTSARSQHYRLAPLFKALTLETNPIPIKCALALKGMITESYRLPLAPLSDQKKAQLKQVLVELGIL